MRDIVRLPDLTARDVGEVGAKAANLGELISAGADVPDGFCLPTSVYDRFVQPVLAPLLGVDPLDGDAVRAAVESVELPDELVSLLAEAFHAIRPEGGGVAVRSSGTSEDTEETSFAGQYHTELGVRSVEELVAALRKCWASMWEPHAIRYRERVGVPHADVSMAVVVQAMVPADAAGVMFVTDRIVIESSWGLGEAVVSGLVTPDRFVVSRDGHRVETAAGHKAQMIVPVDDGVVTADVAPERVNALSITAEQAAELVRLGLVIEQHFGARQDVEWAITDGRIRFLQARPLTRDITAPAEVSWESPIDGAEWARISICDSWLPEPLSPLFASTLFPRLVDRWKQNWSTPDTATVLPDPMAGTINGFAYIRLDGPLNKHPVKTTKLVYHFFKFHLARLERKWRRDVLPGHLARIGTLREVDPSELDTPELRRVIDEAEELSGRYWALLGGLAWYWNGGEWFLHRLYAKLAGPAAGDEGFAVLLQGYPTKTSETDAALYDLARSDAPDEGFARFLDEHGHQVYQLDFVEPTPADDPAAFRATLDSYRSGAGTDPRERLKSLAHKRDELWAKIESELRSSPARLRALRALLRWNRRYALVRDEALYYFTLGWPLIRRGYVELGERLAAAGAIAAADDVFYLTGTELTAALDAVERGEQPANHDEAVLERRKLREEQQQLIPPARVPEGMRVDVAGIDFLPIAFLGRDDSGDDIEGLRGVAVSPGLVTGPARRIGSARDFDKLRSGDVLIATYITPAWSPLLGIAGAVVTDTGGALSHGSIVAREYGIPAVMGTNNATKVIQDGQIVTVDGNRGLVLTERSAS